MLQRPGTDCETGSINRPAGTIGHFVLGQSEPTVGVIKIAYLGTLTVLVWGGVLTHLIRVL